MKRSWDARGFYAIVDPVACGERSPLDVARACIRGGAAALQLRAKALPSREILSLADELVNLCRTNGVLFVLNDRVDLAAMCGADAVHLGQTDMDIPTARGLAPELLLGFSTHDVTQARAAAAAGADYVAFGPVFSTTSKENPDPVVGIPSLQQVVQLLAPVPVVAIGGIDISRAPRVQEAGAAMAAAIGAVCAAADPEAAARSLGAPWV